MGVTGNEYNIETETERRTAAAPSPTQQQPATTHHNLLRRSSTSKPPAAGAGAAVKYPNPAARASGSTRRQPASAAPSGQLQQCVQPDGSSSSRPDRSHPHRHARAPARAAEAKDWQYNIKEMPSSTPPSVQPAPSLQPLLSSAVGKSTRIDVCGIKSNIVKRIGPERAKKYFQHLERFLSSRLSKDEFDKLCLVALGRENRPLHNHLICSILHNASQACGPPVINDPKLVRDVPSSGHALGPVWDNGVALIQNVKENTPLSRRENALTRKSSLNHGEAIIHENGVAHLSDLRRYSQLEQSEHVEPLVKRARVEKEPFNLHDSVHSNGPSALPCRENQGQDILHHSQGPVQAPLGIQLHHTCFGRTQKPLFLASVTQNDAADTCIELGELCDTLSVKKRMEKMAEAEGLEGVSMDCANLLNNGIDVFMKQLIGSCIELVRARSQHGKLRHAALKQQLCRKLINGVSLQNHIPGRGGNIPAEANSISVQDLKAAMELNPRLLGVNASLLLEKINSYD